MNRLLLAFGVLAASGWAWGQTPPGWLIAVEYKAGQGAVSPMHPSCTVRISAAFSRSDHAFAWGKLSVAAAEGEWSNNINLRPMMFGANPGVVNGGTVVGILGGQVHFAPTLPANRANPIGFWEATWSTTNFAARRVPVGTVTNQFWVYSTNSPRSESRLNVLVEGQASIRVIPAPGVAVVAAALLGGRRRWRGTPLSRVSLP